MKRIILTIAMSILFSTANAEDYVHQMSTHEKCALWKVRGAQIVEQIFLGSSKQDQYEIIEQNTPDANLANIQKAQVDIAYKNVPQTDNPYEQIQYKNMFGAAMYDQCAELYINEPH